MDFKSLISKLDSMEAPPKTPAAPELPKSIQLNEDAQMRVLAGQTSVLEEAKKLKEYNADADGSYKHKGTYGKGPSGSGKEDKPKAKKSGEENTPDRSSAATVGSSSSRGVKNSDEQRDSMEESSDAQKASRAKFMDMVKKKKGAKKDVKEAAKPDFLDMDKDSNKKEPFKKAVADKKKAGPKKVDEVSDATKASYVKKASADVGKMATGEKDGSKMLKRMKGIEKAQESKMMPKGKKRPVKESFEQKLTFKQMIKLVQESGGQQAIDPVDAELFAWAQRVAASKFNESATKQEVYAGLVYERMGGVFEMYDVLSETK